MNWMSFTIGLGSGFGVAVLVLWGMLYFMCRFGRMIDVDTPRTDGLG